MTKNKEIMQAEFEFDKANLAKAKEIIAKYPEGRERSAILPLFDLAQRQNDGWLSTAAIEYVASMLNLPYIRAYEVATFYTMFNLKPVGRHHIQVCGTTPCWLRGADRIMTACQETLGIKKGETTNDGMFTLSEVECLGACVNAPMVQINDDFYEDLTIESMKEILQNLQDGKKTKIGSQIGRQCSAPQE
ncbi:MAG: nuoE [Rickettsiaceae bacterium]|jgi:NADH-quinone oxidoreductase subunit E|nr:nuoE [Rickettsiaceae bacterium]